MYHMFDGFGYGMGGGGMIMMVLFWVVIIFLVIYFIKQLTGKDNGMDRQDSALDILKKRYARGEISVEEFEKMKKDILP